ncbi:MAG: hypothetical protein RR689_05280, partial [Mucinivorans sp.]
ALISIGVWAQSGDEQQDRRRGHEQVAAQKVAYITDKVNLTAAEGEKFWPLYNQYWEQRRTIGRAKHKIFRQIEDNLSGEIQIANLVRLQREEADVIERYAKLFATVLPMDKVAKFFVAEESFKGFLFRNRMEKK